MCYYQSMEHCVPWVVPFSRSSREYRSKERVNRALVVQVLLYHKVSKSYYTFMEALCHNHTSFLVRQNHDTFVRVLQSLQLGIKNIDVTTSSQCAMAIDNLATWLHANLIKVDDLHKVHPAAQVPL